MKPGDILEGDNGMRFVIAEGPVAVQGVQGCTSWECTRRGSYQREDGTWDPGECMGYHCATCGQPSSMVGHRNCAAGEAA